MESWSVDAGQTHFDALALERPWHGFLFPPARSDWGFSNARGLPVHSARWGRP